ncbi:MAG: hypothetical protein LBB26_02075 [Puniceicoccales bacterium]|jgi:type III secretion protein C|nr:hypothetical protein [Puniceicoccales bacterium]
MKLFRRFFSSTVLAIGSSLLGGLLQAGEIPWADEHYYHFAQNQDLNALIHDFTAIQQVDVVIGAPLSGIVNGIFENIPPHEFWERLSKAYNLIWFYDGTALYVYPGTEIKTEVISMTAQEASALRKVVSDLDFAGSNTVLRYVPDTRMMVASGPPRFLEVLRTFLAKVQTNAIQNFADETVVQIFPLKYAFAYDVTLDVGTGNGVLIEGVATLLTRILSGMNTIPNVMQESVLLGAPAKPHTLDGVLQQQSAVSSAINQAQQLAAQAAQQDQEAKKQSTQVSQLKGITKLSSKPLRTTDDRKTKTSVEEAEARNLTGKFTAITYDARQNAVIIRDRKELMPFYQSLIDRFDVPTKAVEIDVAIVDINVGRSHKMGIDVLEFLNGERSLLWRTEGGDVTLDDKNLNFYLKVPNIGASGITARLQALESSSAAKTLSRPSVLTLDNIAAVISNNRETYVPVAGAYATDLFTVSAKVALRVIPHIIEIPRSDGTVERKIKLFVSIEDGAMSDSGGSAGMPLVSSSQINTQSILNEGQSLIVGGYYYEHHSDGRRGIPVLKNLPVVGRLFSMADRATETMERLFIISPRIVEVSPDEADPYGKFFQKGDLSGKPTLNMDEFVIPEKPHRNGRKSWKWRGRKSRHESHIATLQYEA